LRAEEGRLIPKLLSKGRRGKEGKGKVTLLLDCYTFLLLIIP
jgi:hypothetical protein